MGPATRADALADTDVVLRSLTEPECFALLFDRHASAVHSYLARRVGAVADDLLSETFLVAFRQRGTYRPMRAEVRPWLFGIATNLVRRHARTEQRRYAMLARLAPESDAGEAPHERVADRIDAQSLSGALAAALASLAAADRETLLLNVWGDLSYPEIAAVLDIPIGTVRSRLHRARTRLRAHLPDYTITDPDGDPT